MKTLLTVSLCLTAAAFAATSAPIPAPADVDAIHALYPKLAPIRDFTLAPDGSLTAWKVKDKPYPQPTDAQLAAAKATLTTRRQALAQVKSQLAAKYGTLASGEKAFYRPVMDAAVIKLATGDLASAKQIIATAPAPTGALQSAQTAMLAAFPR